MGRSRVNRLERKAAGRLEWFELRDGRIHFYDPRKTAMELVKFTLHVLSTEGDEVVEEPPILAKVRAAKNKEAVIRQIEGDGDRSKDIVCLDLLLDVPQTPQDGAL